MRLLAIFVCLLCLGASCEPPNEVRTEGENPGIEPESGVFTVFLTGNELGAMRPCGCSGGQLGGFDRRGALWKGVSEEDRLIVDTGNLIEGRGEQDLIKFNIIMEAYNLLGYDVVNFTREDVQTAVNLGYAGRLESGFEVLSAAEGVGGAPDNKIGSVFRHEDPPVRVAVYDSASDPTARLDELFADAGRAGSILLVENGDRSVVDYIRQNRLGVDCVILRTDSDEPQLLSEPGEMPVVASVGYFGRYVTILKFDFDKPNGPSVRYGRAAVSEDMPKDPQQVNLYQTYQLLVKEANLLESYPRFKLEGDLKFVGSDRCKSCHEYEYEKWSTKAHANAFESLVEVGSQYDPECVVCHVVGMEYESGYITEEKTPDLKNVGCENCHGPGSAHIANPAVKTREEGDEACLKCHTPEKSTHFAGNKDEYFEKIVHWREP